MAEVAASGPFALRVGSRLPSPRLRGAFINRDLQAQDSRLPCKVHQSDRRRMNGTSSRSTRKEHGKTAEGMMSEAVHIFVVFVSRRRIMPEHFCVQEERRQHLHYTHCIDRSGSHCVVVRIRPCMLRRSRSVAWITGGRAGIATRHRALTDSYSHRLSSQWT